MALTTEWTRALVNGASERAPGLWQRLRRARAWPLLPLAILVPFLLIAVFAGVIAPYDPTEPIPGAKIFEPPFWMAGANPDALLGTDFQGRDVLSRLIFGARVSLIVGAMGTIVAGGIGRAEERRGGTE